MILKLKFLGGTALARHYEKPGGVRQWVPRSVCKVLADGHRDVKSELHEVEIQDWWLQENPFDRPVPQGQGELF